MATTEPSPAPGSNRPPRTRTRRPRRGGHRNNGPASADANANTNATPNSTAQVPNGSLALRPASVAPLSDSNCPAPSNPRNSNANNRGGGNGRRGGFGRGGRRGGGHGQPMANGRVFGGQLTSNSHTSPTSDAGSLAGDAPAFTPGHPIATRPGPSRAPRARRMSKSQAADLATRTHEDITNGQYECAICTNEVLPNSKIWNCKSCWSVLHLSCVKKWSKNEVSTHQQRAVENGELPPPRQWRCPGCNLPKEDLPISYTCWCEKEIEPRSVAGLPPHSCGQSCSKKRIGHCPHPCDLMCHAGPCPPCAHMGPSLPCFCGKETVSRRCLDTKYESGWACGQICDDVLPCGEHNCERSCHEGLCGSCEVLIESTCYCGKVEKTLPCSERDEERESQAPTSTLDGENLATRTWIGSFDCGSECRRPFDCGKPDHYCETKCHPQDLLPAHCPLSPDVVTTCPCGKTPIPTLLETPRTDCTQHIPHCQEKCELPLKCGHTCQGICHEGECRPCFQSVLIACRCGRTTSNTMCHQGLDEKPQCPRVCRATLNCGRHECGERCCSGEKKASERQAAKRKHRALNAPPTEENIEAEHICLKVCGRTLKCGEHACAELCHKGPFSAIVPDNAKTRLRHVINRAEGRKAFAITPVPMLAMPLTPKQAVKCLASKTSEGNSKKTLDCNDECLKLQRNAKLAAALNIDPSTHTDDHIPYSQQTLDMVKDMLKFCQTYEREFRVFAADPSEKRLRFKPMPSHQRAFLHSLAEDYGLDSESQDPEPHRHVSIFKTPRFVSAPLKTLAQCVKVKPVAVVEAASSKRLVATAEPFNAFLLSNPRFGLTIDEIHTDLSSEFANAGLDFDVSFLPSGEVVLRGKAPETWYTKVDSALTAMQHSLVQKVKALQLASTVVLCSVDSSLNVVRREDDHLGGGWSQVAKGASGSKAPVRPEIGVKSSFTILGTRMAAKKKKEEQDSAVDDWEKEVEAWDA
ncbi:hypothetical protein BHYA_0134g00080 [Botrytis hyacinthi]|uniref:R3H domain-containing protein n=1 Tax=Botrytis hyacinthi TaxID=278943 RepID=A0A4Z1GRC8_9HELO|nr:hypothetical protein BHYA_0134g00080 [Botrytis hyacinthi]